MEQAVRIRQTRRPKQRRRRRPLHQPAGVHHRDVVRKLAEQREVMRDEEGGETQPVAQSHQLLEDLALGHHVESRRGLVEDHDLGIQGERHRDHRPLTHAARHLVGVAAQSIRGHADQLEQIPGPVSSRCPAELRTVGGEQFVKLRADRAHRVESVQCTLQNDRDLGPSDGSELLLARGE